MALVDVPEDFCATHEVHVHDISSLPKDAMDVFDNSFEREREKFKIEETPYPCQETDLGEFASDPGFEASACRRRITCRRIIVIQMALLTIIIAIIAVIELPYNCLFTNWTFSDLFG